jgi:hypothetical protein
MTEIKDPKHKKWLNWIDWVHQETQNLLVKTYLYDRYVEIVKANPEVQNPRDFHDWAMRNYFESALMSIRRLTDTHPDAISLTNLLKELEESSQLITLEFYRRDYSEGTVDENGAPDGKAWTFALAEDRFREEFGVGAAVLNAKVVKTDIAELKKQIAIVETFIDNTLAHHNKGGKGKLSLETKHARSAIEIIEKLAIKYLALMGQDGYDSLTPTYQYDPEKIFTQAWIKPTAY